VIVKLLLLLFLYDVPSERELMEQLRVRLDFLWFLGFDLDTDIPDRSVLSQARARWGIHVFEQLFVQSVNQRAQAGLVNGRLLHVDSTLVKAQAHKDTIVPSGPELVGALRQVYQQQAAELQLPDRPQRRHGHRGHRYPHVGTSLGHGAGRPIGSRGSARPDGSRYHRSGRKHR
jgi:hypothetical protein